jgi:hypothetical protein
VHQNDGNFAGLALPERCGAARLTASKQPRERLLNAAAPKLR